MGKSPKGESTTISTSTLNATSFQKKKKKKIIQSLFLEDEASHQCQKQEQFSRNQNNQPKYFLSKWSQTKLGDGSISWYQKWEPQDRDSSVFMLQKTLTVEIEDWPSYFLLFIPTSSPKWLVSENPMIVILTGHGMGNLHWTQYMGENEEWSTSMQAGPSEWE